MTTVDVVKIGSADASYTLPTVNAANTDFLKLVATKYRSLALKLSGTFSATIRVQVSYDNEASWDDLTTINNYSATVNSTTLQLYVIPANCILRIRCTAYVSGSIAGVAAFGSLQYIPPTIYPIHPSNGTIADLNSNGVNGLFNASGNTQLLGVMGFLWNGSTKELPRTPNIFKDLNAVAIGAIATVWTPTAGKKFRLMGGVISVSAAANVLFEDNAAAAFIYRTPKLLVDTPFAFTLGGNGFLSAAANNVLKATSSAAANITGTLYGTEE